jgi:hypothetical protein
MTTDTTERADEVVDRAEIRDGRAVVAYTQTERALADLRQRYGGAAFDCTTTAGDKAARAARLELVTLRTALEKRRAEFKAPALEFGRLIDAEAKRITGEILALEIPIDAAIKADEKRRAAEKAERERIEAARLDRHRRAINEIRAAATGHAAANAATLAEAITAVVALDVSPSRYDEFAPAAQQAQADTLDALRRLHAAAVEREAEAARLDAERARLARVEEFQKRLHRIRALPLAVLGKGSAAIATAIGSIEALKFDTWAEYAGQAEDARTEALQQMREAHADAVERERVAAAQAAEAERLQRQQAEMAEQQRRQDEERARVEAQRQAQDLRALVDSAFKSAVDRVGYERASAVRDAYAAEGGVLSSDADDYIAALEALQPITTPPGEAGGQVDGCRAPEDQPAGCSGPGTQDHTSLPESPVPPAAEAPAVVGSADKPAGERVAPTVKLGDLCARFGTGVALREAFISGALAVHGENGPRGVVLYTEAQVVLIAERLAALCQSVRADAALRAGGVAR